MDDSPLSITASIAGILTFVVAIITFVYVRYSILQNGDEEMRTIFNSVSATLEETRELSGTLTVIPPDSPGSSQLAHLISDLYATEFFIILRYMQAYGIDLKELLSAIPDQQAGEGISIAWAEVMREAERLGDQPTTQWPRRFRVFLQWFHHYSAVMDVFMSTAELSSYAWAILRQVVRLGETYRLMRWYMVREQVMEKMKQRETLRSRIVFHQALKIVVPAFSQENLVHSLIDSINRLEAKLGRIDAWMEDVIEQQHEPN